MSARVLIIRLCLVFHLRLEVCARKTVHGSDKASAFLLFQTRAAACDIPVFMLA